MTITQMQYFLAVCEHGSISKSADILHVSRPSISMAIKDMEKGFGVQLFSRKNKQFSLTDEGQYAYENIKEIINRVESLETHMASIGKARSRVSIGIPLNTGVHLLSKVIDDFHREYPDIKLYVSQDTSAGNFNKLEEGTTCAAFIVENDELPKFIETQHLLSTEYMFCVSPSHPLAGADSVSIEDIKDETLILNGEISNLTRSVKKIFYEKGYVPNILMYVTQSSLIREYVASGKAASFFSKEYVKSLAQNDIVGIPMQEKLPLNFALAWVKDRPQNRDAKLLIDYIIEKSPL